MNGIQTRKNYLWKNTHQQKINSFLLPHGRKTNLDIQCKVTSFKGKKYKSSLPDVRLKIDEDYRKTSLHNEIIQYAVAVGLTKREREKRTQLIDEISEVLKDEFPNCSFQGFGSYETGLMLHSSPIDIGIQGIIQFDELREGLDRDQHDKACKLLGDLIPVLRKRFPTRVKPPLGLVPKRNPELELRIDFIEIRISFLDDLSLKVDEQLKQYSEQFMQFKPLAITLKACFKEKKLLGDLYGGISPYCLYLFVVAHLMMCQRDGYVMDDVGNLLLSFVRRYAHQVQFMFKAISVKRGGIVPIQYVMKNQSNKSHLYNTNREIYRATPRVCIEDPITGRDIALKMIKFLTVKKNYKFMVKLLQWAEKNPSHKPFDAFPTLRMIWQVDDSLKRVHPQWTGFP